MSRITFQVAAILVFAATIFFVWDFSQRVVTNVRLTETATYFEQRVAQARTSNTELRAQLAHASSPAYAEAIARAQWRWVRDGETLAVTQVIPATPAPVAPPAPPPAPAKAWWQDLYDFLFGP